MVDAAESQQRQVVQARPHGGTNEERAGEHRHRNADTGNDRQVGAPVVGKTASEQGAKGHVCVATGSNRWPTSSN